MENLVLNLRNANAQAGCAEKGKMARFLWYESSSTTANSMSAVSKVEVGTTLDKASIQHPMSIHSAYIGTSRRPAGNQHATSRKVRSVLRYAAMLLMLVTLGVGQMWAWTSRQTGTISSVYLTGSMNSWSTNSSSWAFSEIDNNHWTGTFYIKGQSSDYSFKLYINAANRNDYYSTGYNYHKDWTGGEADIFTDKGDATITPRETSTSKYIKIVVDFYASYGSNEHGYLSVTQTTVSDLSPTFTGATTNMNGGATRDFSSSCTGGSGSYTYTYTCHNTTDDTDASSALSATSGTSTTFTAPVEGTAKTYRITVTATDANSQLTELGFSSQSTYKDITVNATLTPSLTWAASNPVTPTSMVSGNDVTLNVVRANTSNTITWEYTTDDGSHWSSLTPKSTSNSGQTAVWTIPEAHGETQTYKFRAKITANSLTTAKSAGVSVYGKKIIHVKNSNNWGTLYLYAWDSDGAHINGDWPGATGAGSNSLSCTNTGGQWWDVVITSQVSGFVLDCNVSGDANQTADLSYSTYTDDRCLAIGTDSGKRALSNTAVDCPAKPDVTTAAAGSFTNSKATLNASDVNANNDAITAYGFKWGTTTDCANTRPASNLSSTTFSYQLTDLTAGQTYYFKAYATNGQGTTYGDVVSFTVPYKVTISKSTGCNTISPSAGTYYYSAGFEITATRSTGYTFSAWSKTNGDLSSASSPSTGTNKVTFTPTSDNATITATYTENAYNATVSAGANGDVSPKGTVAIKQATGTEITATPIVGYRFSSWTISGGGITPTSSSTNPQTFKATTTGGSIQANFARSYAFVEGRLTVYNSDRNAETNVASAKGGWDKNSTRIGMEYDGTNHVFYRHTYKTPAELSAQQNNEYQWFAFKTSSESGSLTTPQAFEPASNQEMTTAGSGNKKTISAASTDKHVRFNSDYTDGYAILYFDESGVWYTLEHSLRYDGNGGSGDAPATTYHLNGTNGTAAANSFTARTNYSFVGWNTAEYITGTNYAVGDPVPMTANTILYAKWNRTVTLNQNSATANGSSSVVATWNCSTLPAITNPSKNGYTFGGWNTADDGSGSLVINTSGQLQANKYNWTDTGGRFKRTPSTPESESKPLYALWTQTVTLNANTANHGSGDNTSATIILNATAKSSITHCTPATGYHLEGYYTAATDGTKILEANGDFAGTDITNYITSGKWTKAGATTLYAHYEPNTYDVTLTKNGGTGSDQVVEATYDAAMPTTLKVGGAVTVHTKVGYKLLGYWDDASSGNQYYSYNDATSTLSSYRTWNKTAATTLYAHWQARQYTVTLDVDETHHGNIASATTSQTVTYNAVTVRVENRPTGEDGYALDGYYTDHNGVGVKLINGDGTWIASVAGHTDASKNWIHDGGITLYAYYKKAEITALTFESASVAVSGTVGVTPTIEPTPDGTTKTCWYVMYNNGNLLSPQPEINWNGTKATFTAPASTGTYKVAAVLRTGNDCGGGTMLDSVVGTFTVGGSHVVTVMYKCDDISIKASDTIHVAALGTKSVSAPDVFGYTFDHWVLGDGVSSAGSLTTSSITISTIYDGTLTAVYTKRKLILLDISQTFGSGKWTNPYVYLYNSDGYWDDQKGAGATGANCIAKGAMTAVPGASDLYYYDYSLYTETFGNKLAFTWGDATTYDNFNGKEAIYRTDFSEGTPLYVPAVGQDKTHLEWYGGGHNDYYLKGYWTNYVGEQTGYTIIIRENNAGQAEIKRQRFTSANKYMTMKATLDLEANTSYKMEILRDNGKYYKNPNFMKDSPKAQHTSWDFKEDVSIGGITSTAAGSYVFTLSYSDYGGNKDFQLRLTVDYPAATNDFQILYYDNSGTTHWSQSHTSGWRHPSRLIKAKANAVDTISFFVAKSNSPTLYARKVNSIDAESGQITWGSLNIASAASQSLTVDSTAVWNFKITQSSTAGTIQSIEPIGAYTGSYYIRCDAVNSKWDNYTTDMDHKMTHSEFSESAANKFGDKFSHYKTKWCPFSTNIKFVIANDYSPCISDTLIKDTPFLNNMDNNGTLKDDNGRPDLNNKYSANVRFMWNRKTNKISRAYIGSSTNTSRLFLVLQGDQELHGEDNEATSDEGMTYGVVLEDKQNWMYEKHLMIKPGTKFKLFASYALKTPYQMDSVQFFCGANGAWTAANTVELIGGSGDYQLARIIYDFKTNRLVCAWLPSSADISGTLDINADVMVIREHQEDADMITFANNESKLDHVKTVYGVMKFNRWTLNNKSSAAGHAVLDPSLQKSIYERSLYFISFPFDVNLSDVFGFGQYGVHWIIENYDGEGRAKNGYWIDSDPNWKFVTNPDGYVLKANKGYILALDLDLMKDGDETFWQHNIQTVELFFPSTAELTTIQQTTCTIAAPDPSIYQCTINRPGKDGDRRVKDSYWRCLGVPSFANYNTTLLNGSTTIAWQTADNTLPYLYEWNMDDNTLSAQSTTNFEFKTMHSYLTQCSTQIIWTTTNMKPLAPRRSDNEMLKDREFRLQLDENGVKKDQAYVRLSVDETVTAGFEFGNDMSKELNINKSNIYTLIGEEMAAANSLPLSTEQTTIVPVGVVANAAGEYTFSMPDGTDGVGVTLVDEETGIRTSLSALPYTISLPKGDYNSRFYLEISPIHGTPTAIQDSGFRIQDSVVRKVIIDQNMYIIRDGKMYDARGARVE